MARKSKGRIEKFNKNNELLDFKKARKEKEKAEKAARKAHRAEQKRRREEPPATEAERKHRERRRSKLRYKRLIIGVIAAVLVLVVGFSTWNIVRLKIEQKQLVAKQEQLEKKKKKLKSEMKTVNDPEYIEQQARRQLKRVMPGEVLYKLEDGKDTKDSND